MNTRPDLHVSKSNKAHERINKGEKSKIKENVRSSTGISGNEEVWKLIPVEGSRRAP